MDYFTICASNSTSLHAILLNLHEDKIGNLEQNKNAMAPHLETNHVFMLPSKNHLTSKFITSRDKGVDTKINDCSIL